MLVAARGTSCCAGSVAKYWLESIAKIPTSAMVRECEFAYITRAGVEIGVASTKAFSTQLVGLRVRHGGGQTEEPGQERGRRTTVALLRRAAPGRSHKPRNLAKRVTVE